MFVQDLHLSSAQTDESALYELVDFLGKGGAGDSEVFGELHLVVFHLDGSFSFLQMVEQIIDVTAADTTER